MSLGDTIEQAAKDAGLTLVKKVTGTSVAVKLKKEIIVGSLSERYLVIGKALYEWTERFEKELFNIVSFDLEHTASSVIISVALYESEIPPSDVDTQEWMTSLIQHRYGKDWNIEVQ